MNYENKNESVIKDITSDINQNFYIKECNDTGKKWIRNCPKCNKEIVYKNKYNCIYAMDKNTNCMTCNATGKKHSIETIAKIKNKNLNKTVSTRTKEKLSQINTGKKISDVTKLKIKNSLIGNKRMLGKHHSTDTKNKISTSLKGKMCGVKNPMYGKIGPNKGKIFSQETRKKISMSRIGKKASLETKRKFKELFLKRKMKYGKIFFPSYNETACLYFEWLNKWMGWNGQFATNGGEFQIGNYFVDYYEPSLNIVIEYDENHHFKNGKLKEKDIFRMEYIKKILQCKFFRYTESNNLIREY